MAETVQGERISRCSDDLLATEHAAAEGAAQSTFPDNQHASKTAAEEKNTCVCMWDDSSRFLSYLFMPLSKM